PSWPNSAVDCRPSIGTRRPGAPMARQASGEKERLMPCTVFVNGRGVVHQTSGGLSTVFPDVCQTPTPGGPVPIPYPNIGKAADTSGGPSTVACDGSMPMVKGAQYRMTSGDEAGTAGGVISGTIKGEA